MVSLNAMNSQRETFENQENIRLHGILTSGGATVNSTPADGRYEGKVRAGSDEAIADASAKMDRCLRAGALALSASGRIVSIPGYLSMNNDQELASVLKDNTVQLVGENNSVSHPKAWVGGGSTDMGDLSHLMPAIHPYSSGASGLGHGVDYLVQDYDQTVVNPAKALPMTVIDSLADGAAKIKEVVAKSPPRMTRTSYVRLQESKLSEEFYEGW